MHHGRDVALAGVGTPPRRGRSRPDRLRAALPDAVLLALVVAQLLPFLGAFHQSADDNFWQLVALATGDDIPGLAEKTRTLAQQQGRVGLYAAMPLVLLGAVLPEYAWGRLLVVALFGLLLLAFCHVLALRFATPLTRAALLLTACATPMAAYHLPPNAYPLLVTVPLLALLALHLRLAAPGALPRRARAAVSVALAALMLLLEYAFVAGLALAALAVLTARGTPRRRRALLLHAPALLAAAAAYVGYRVAFPSGYPGNALEVPPPLDILRLQALHIANGTVFPHLGPAHLAPGAAGPGDLAAAACVFAAAAWLAARLLPALARGLRPGAALGVALACAGWAWLNTLPHALTPKYQAWCRLGECAYVDSRVAALAAGAAAAVGIAALLRVVERRAPAGAARAAALLCAAAVGAAGAATFLHNRAAAREMAWRERPFAVLRDAACAPGADLARDPVVGGALARIVLWPAPPTDAPPAEAYLATYRDALARLGLACRPVPFAPATPGPVEFLHWSKAEPTGRWSLGPAGVLLLRHATGAAGFVLTLAAYVPPGEGPRRVTARTPGGAACTVLLDGSARDLFVPWTAGPGAREQVLVLETPDAVSPSAAGESADRRVLGVFLSALGPVSPGGTPPTTLDLRDCRGAGG